MASSEIIPGIHVVRGKFAGEFGFIASYLIVESGEVLVLDPGTAGDPGDRLEKAIRNLGLDPKNDVVGILCTHGHPDHAAGAGRLKKATGAPILIHQDDAELLQTPAKFLNERPGYLSSCVNQDIKFGVCQFIQRQRPDKCQVYARPIISVLDSFIDHCSSTHILKDVQ